MLSALHWIHTKQSFSINFSVPYRHAAENEANGIHTVSTDEKPGIQALEPIAPTLPMEPGQPERREHSYDRHGTTCLFGNLNVATGEIVTPKFNATRTEEDFAENIDAIVATDPEAGVYWLLWLIFSGFPPMRE